MIFALCSNFHLLCLRTAHPLRLTLYQLPVCTLHHTLLAYRCIYVRHTNPSVTHIVSLFICHNQNLSQSMIGCNPTWDPQLHLHLHLHHHHHAHALTLYNSLPISKAAICCAHCISVRLQLQHSSIISYRRVLIISHPILRGNHGIILGSTLPVVDCNSIQRTRLHLSISIGHYSDLPWCIGKPNQRCYRSSRTLCNLSITIINIIITTT